LPEGLPVRKNSRSNSSGSQVSIRSIDLPCFELRAGRQQTRIKRWRYLEAKNANKKKHKHATQLQSQADPIQRDCWREEGGADSPPQGRTKSIKILFVGFRILPLAESIA